MNSVGESLRSGQMDMVSVKSYKSQNEYIIAMKEDLSEWLKELYSIEIHSENFFDYLDNGSLLCKHANNLREYILRDSSLNNDVSILSYRSAAVSGSFQARDNISIFIKWCKQQLGIPDTLIFETEDLVQRRNERNLILGLLEVGRRGARHGMLAPSIIQLEQEIDEEIRRDKELEIQSDAAKSITSKTGPSTMVTNTNGKNSKMVNNTNGTNTTSVTNTNEINKSVKFQKMPIQVDFLSLDEMVRIILKQCKCEYQYPMVRLSEGKYTHGDNLSPIFLRVLRSHVMVRTGGGWDTLNSYLDRHDPCRSNSKEHRGSLAFISKPAKTCDTKDLTNSDLNKETTYDDIDAKNVTWEKRSNISDSIVSSLSSLSNLSVNNSQPDSCLLNNTVSTKSLSENIYADTLNLSVADGRLRKTPVLSRKSLPDASLGGSAKPFALKQQMNNNVIAEQVKYANKDVSSKNREVAGSRGGCYSPRTKSLSRELILNSNGKKEIGKHQSRSMKPSEPVYIKKQPPRRAADKVQRKSSTANNSIDDLVHFQDEETRINSSRTVRRHSQDNLLSSNDFIDDAAARGSWDSIMKKIDTDLVGSRGSTSIRPRKDDRKHSVSRIPVPVASQSRIISSLKRSDSGVDVWDMRHSTKECPDQDDFFVNNDEFY